MGDDKEMVVIVGARRCRLCRIAVMLTAFAAGCGKSGREPVGNQPVAPVNTARLEDSIRECVAAIAADISAIRGNYPELAAWRGTEAEADGNRIDYEYKFKGWAKAENLIEPGGCLILVDVRETERMQWSPKYRLNNLGRDVYVFVQGGKRLVDAINGIIDKRLAPLVEFDRSRGRPLPPPDNRPSGNRPEPEDAHPGAPAALNPPPSTGK
jgi:hypothetical protein